MLPSLPSKLTRASVQKHKSDVADLTQPITRDGGAQLRQAPAHFIHCF